MILGEVYILYIDTLEARVTHLVPVLDVVEGVGEGLHARAALRHDRGLGGTLDADLILTAHHNTATQRQ